MTRDCDLMVFDKPLTASHSQEWKGREGKGRQSMSERTERNLSEGKKGEKLRPLLNKQFVSQ